MTAGTAANQTRPGWLNDIAGGAVVAIFLLPNLLGAGVVTVQPLGPDWLAAGVLGAFAACIAAALLRALPGGGGLHVNAPRATQAAMLAGLMSEVAANPAFLHAVPDAAARPLLLLGAAMLALTLAGGAQCLLGLIRVGGMIRFIPFPVVAGFTNGFAVAIALGQLPLMLGFRNWSLTAAAVQGDPWMLSPWPLLCGGAGLAATLAAQRYARKLPAGLLGLAGGSLVYLALSQGIAADRLGPLVGALPGGLPFVWSGGDIAALLALPGILPALASPVLATAATLALISSLQSLVSLAAADALTRHRSDGNHELIRQGVGNIAAALGGGTAVGGSPLYTRIVYDNGGRGRLAQLTLALTLLAGVGLFADVVSAIPLSVMAGVVVATMIGAIDPWSIRIAQQLWASRQDPAQDPASRRQMAADLAVVCVVGGLVVVSGAMAALAAGLTASLLPRLWREKAA